MRDPLYRWTRITVRSASLACRHCHGLMLPGQLAMRRGVRGGERCRGFTATPHFRWLFVCMSCYVRYCQPSLRVNQGDPTHG